MVAIINDQIIEILENNDIRELSTNEQDGELVSELEYYSDAGEDVIIDIWHDGTKKSFIESFEKYAEDFDPDEHAEMWVSHRGEGGCPSSIRELIEDADSIKEHLETTAKALREVA